METTKQQEEFTNRTGYAVNSRFMVHLEREKQLLLQLHAHLPNPVVQQTAKLFLSWTSHPGYADVEAISIVAQSIKGLLDNLAVLR